MVLTAAIFMPEYSMSCRDYQILLVSDHVSDRIVFEQMLNTYQESITLSHESTFVEDDKFNLVLCRDNIKCDKPMVILDQNEMRVGDIMDQIESILFKNPYNQAISFKQYHIASNSLTLMHSDREIQLTETERNIIYHLMTAKDQGLSREDMLQSVWAYHQDIETHTLETHIYRLRQKIEPDSTKPQHIIYDSNLYKLT
jgi:hypothetical protein